MKMLILRFFDTLSKNEELKEYYVKIESLYNGNSICISGQKAEVTEYEATEAVEDDQCSESDISSRNDQAYNIFLSKFSYALGKLLNQYDYSSLLKHDHSKQCVYFKYWFYDKILKNIFSNEKLKDFYEEIKEGDKEDESEPEDVEEIRDEIELEEEFLEREEEEEEEEELIDGSLIDSEEDDTAECEKSQHGCKGENSDSKKILFSLDNSSICNIYKLNLDNIKNIKLLYDYLEGYKSKNKSSVEAEITKSTYCSFLNETIELYKEKRKCRIDYLDNAYCQEVEECRNNYSHTKISTLSCNTEKSSSDPPQHSKNGQELQEARPAPFPRGRGIGSDNSNELVSTVFHSGNHMKERQTLGDGENITESGHTNTQITSTDNMKESHSMDSEASTSCHHGSAGRSCESSLQQLSAMSTESRTKLNIGGQRNTEKHVETEVGSQEETGSTNTIVSSASSVLGVSALLFTLYKFTPLGSLIRNRRGGMNTWNINEEGHDQNLFSPDLENENWNNNNYSIGYYSLGNT
ncbi:PIR Superfamily Protein [Plasmodium ovale wallikeri]|uniref:PIR Superfamily Protein n=2 Tax=Plasmodium ovale TaxID=36330 RepID=A0A1A9ADE1_PLAOA|nr:PIR Superfamily Protein [Plasmodium ovale wallikeri]SBT56180.1 PIR Superfamily Protein [Plasmodium ovale wallikeri]